MSQNDQKGKVNIAKLLRYAEEELPSECALREILLSEHSDEMPIETFLIKALIWLKLSKLPRR